MNVPEDWTRGEGGPWVVIHRASGTTDAHIVKGRLETEGIPVLLKYEAAGAIYAITLDGLGEVRILVPENWADAARDVLAARSFEWEDGGD